MRRLISKKRLYLMWVVILAFLLVALFPPMDVTRRMKYFGEIAVEGDMAWHFIFANRTEETEYYVFHFNHIKAGAWTIEFIVLGVVAAGLWFTLGRGGEGKN